MIVPVSTERIAADHESGNCIEQHSKQDLLNSTILFTIAWIQVALRSMRSNLGEMAVIVGKDNDTCLTMLKVK